MHPRAQRGSPGLGTEPGPVVNMGMHHCSGSHIPRPTQPFLSQGEKQLGSAQLLRTLIHLAAAPPAPYSVQSTPASDLSLGQEFISAVWSLARSSCGHNDHLHMCQDGTKQQQGTGGCESAGVQEELVNKTAGRSGGFQPTYGHLLHQSS